MKIYYIANARMPTEKAHGIQIAKMCEAFIEAGTDVTLVMPGRATDPSSIRDYYGLRVDVPTVTLFAFDWYTGGRILYRISSFSFMVSSFFFLWRRRNEKEAVVYTVDFDDWSYAQLPLLSFHYFSEMHGSKPHTFVNRFFFRNISGIITINRLIKDRLQETFSLLSDCVIVEPDAVDATHFTPMPRARAREHLGLAHELKLVLYVGRILEWKGLELLATTASVLGPGITIGIVGGTRERFVEVTGIVNVPGNLVFYGERDYAYMPVWINAANAVLMTATAHNELSYRWTSPMKAFEYMACGVPIIAADAPSMREIVSNATAFLYQPDEAQSLAHEIRAVFNNQEEARHRGDAALVVSRTCSWRARAEHTLKFMKKSISLTYA